MHDCDKYFWAEKLGLESFSQNFGAFHVSGMNDFVLLKFLDLTFPWHQLTFEFGNYLYVTPSFLPEVDF